MASYARWSLDCCWNRMKALEDLFLQEIKELYDAEGRILKALPKMAKAANRSELRAAFETHEKQTKKHSERLEKIFQALGRDAETLDCEPIIQIIKQGDELIALKKSEPAVLDAALIAAAQKVEHYEISTYGTARSHARMLGYGKVADLLEVTLREEEQTDTLLTQLANKRVNFDAVKAPFANARTSPRAGEDNSSFGFGALLMGALIGAAFALLYAPKTGDKLRRELSDKGQNLRTSAENLVERGRQTIEEQRTKLQDSLTGS